MENEEIRTDLRPELVGNIAGAFVVPSYQRGYRWGRAEVTRLLDDIRDSGGNKYFLQPVVVKRRDDGKWELVDGQQRLTTLFLILRYIRQHLPAASLKYSLEYETRASSADYLQHPTSEDSQSNIDFFHIFGAFECVREWFDAQDNPTLEAINFYKYLSESVYVIWYEAPPEVESTTLFTRLNIGRIPLTDAELVKALVLARSRSAKRDREIAAQWDGIERDLRIPEVWAFVTGKFTPEATHIALLLDTLAGRPNSRATAAVPHLRDASAADRGVGARPLESGDRSPLACHGVVRQPRSVPQDRLSHRPGPPLRRTGGALEGLHQA